MGIYTSILFFLATSYGLGASLLYFFKQSDEILEKHFIRQGVGLAAWVVLGVLLSDLHVPLNWWLFLVLASPGLIIGLIEFKSEIAEIVKKKSLKLGSVYALGALLVAVILFLVYLQGAFSYTHLEDGDPWHHAMSARYVAGEKQLFVDNSWELRYLDGYPPGYALIMGMTYQVSHDMVWNLKFFNSLFICLGLVYFFFFVKNFFDDQKIAIISTVLLAAIPAYFSHFIWAHTFVVALFFPLFYAVLRCKDQPRWWLIGSVVLGSLWMIQSTQPAKAMVMLACLGIGHLIHDRKVWKYYAAVAVGGIFVSLLWYGPIYMKYDNFLEGAMRIQTSSDRWTSKSHFGPLGSSTRLYLLSDFTKASSDNLITSPVGLGLIIFLLAIAGIILAAGFKKDLLKKKWQWSVVLLWLVFTFAGLFGGTLLPLALFSFRFWLIFPIPVSLLGALAIIRAASAANKIGIPKIASILAILLLVVCTAGSAKYSLNTMQWGSEQGQYQYGQNEAYEFIRELPEETGVFDVCHRQKFGDHIILAYDKKACPWCDEELDFRESIYDQDGWSVSPDQISDFMDERGYEYLFVEGNCVDTLQRNLVDKFNMSSDNARLVAQDSTNNLISNLTQSGVFNPVHQTQGSVIFRLP